MCAQTKCVAFSFYLQQFTRTVCACVRACVRACATPDSPSTNNTVLELHYTILLELHYTILSLTVGRLSTISHTLTTTHHTLRHGPEDSLITSKSNPTQPNPTQHSATISKEQHTCVRKSIYATDRPDGHERTANCKLLWQHFFF